MYKLIGESIVRQFTEDDVEIISDLLDTSQTMYPEQYKALNDIYAKSSPNKKYYDFLRARRIINCCFGENDSRLDIDEFGIFNFEQVKCPLIAECKYYRIVCRPKFNSQLSEREFEVMKMYFRHISTDEIAEKLFLSIHTVNNHRRNSLAKLGLHSLEEFQDYAHNNKIFER